MSAAARGWCPGLFAPMQSGDGWLVRLKPRLSRLTAAQAGWLAGEATLRGNGIIELTGRGNLQLRGLTLAGAEAFAGAAVQAGLASADPALERIRSIQLAPLADAACGAVAAALEQVLATDARLHALPGKFGFAVGSVDAVPACGGSADIRLLREASGGWQVGLSGAAGPVRCAAGDAARQAGDLALDWLARGAPDRRRPAYRAGAPGPGTPEAGTPEAGTPEAGTPEAGTIGWLAAASAFGLGLAFGQLDADALTRLADWSRVWGDGLLHLTPWRVVLLSGIDAAGAAAITASAGGALILRADDPRRAVSACIGRAGCSAGTVDARADARALLAAGVRVPGLHVSGCAKGCAHPGAAAITLVGSQGRYGLVRAGRAGDTAQTDGLSVSQLARLLAEDADRS